MTMPIRAYPLTWPEGWKRTAAGARKPAHFRRASKKDWQGNWQNQRSLTISEATLRVRKELERMGIHDDDIVVSTNLVLRLDGSPRSDQREPGDPGVAVYWQHRGNQRCIAIDQYTKVTGNLAAIAATLDAMRAIERHGGAEILDRAFTGFVALPPPDGSMWWDVLKVSRQASRAEIETAYRLRRSESHPDRGGSPEAFSAVQIAYEQSRSAP